MVTAAFASGEDRQALLSSGGPGEAAADAGLMVDRSRDSPP